MFKIDFEKFSVCIGWLGCKAILQEQCRCRWKRLLLDYIEGTTKCITIGNADTKKNCCSRYGLKSLKEKRVTKGEWKCMCMCVY